MKTYSVTCKGLKNGETWVLGEAYGNTLGDALFDLATRDATFRTHYNKVTGLFWGQKVHGRVVP